MTPEARIQREIMLALSQAGCLVWRNNTGQAWQGKQIHRAQDQITLSQCRPVHFGLCKGSSDLICISPEGFFVAIEVKTSKGRATNEQETFISAVNKAGGRAGIARNPEEALDIALGR